MNMNASNNSMKMVKLKSLWVLSLLLSTQAFAFKNIGTPPVERPRPVDTRMKAAGCQAASAQRDLDVNNVRTTILNGGDMWWNLNNARYEIPKITGNQVSKHSLFAGALWIGGTTNGNLRIAGQTYRQSGNDYFPGPLVIGTASISAATCKQYDRIWKISLIELDAFRKNPNNWANPSNELLTWPCMGNVNEGEAKYLAPFFDNDGDGAYSPYAGDYPTFDQQNEKNIPDQMLFILYNDKGNIHSETQGLPIGLEFHTQAFAYSTNDEVNNMTFYRTTIFNRGNETIDSTVFGQWVDPDLGNYVDDYVECDVSKNLGICYNGDDNDEGILGYGLNPPSIGVNFFEGPRRPDGSEIGLTKFVYYNNNFDPTTGNPTRPEHYWNYLNGRWKDGQPIGYGGNGVGGTPCNYMFPGSTDTALFRTQGPWTERTAGNPPADRRFLQTAGSFSLLPGAVNKVTIGVVWARASSGGATGSFNLLKEASNKAFILFRDNFALRAGPDAPQLVITELNKSLVFKMINTENLENFEDSFAGPCQEVTASNQAARRTLYKFQGYQIFQLKIPNIPSNIYDTEQARLVAQFDIKDGVARLVNSIFSDELEENVKRIMVTGADEGVQHSFEITKDAFQSGSDQTLVNFKDYHYVILAYASATNCPNDQTQYLPGRKTVGRNELTVYSATPHNPFMRNNGTQINARFGDGLPITQIEGLGNGGNAVELSDETVNTILNSPNAYVKERTYKPGQGPLNVKVIDPLKIPQEDLILYLRDTSSLSRKTDTLNPKTTFWYLSHNGNVTRSRFNIENSYEQLFPDLGISLNVTQPIQPGNANIITDRSNGFINSEIIYSDARDRWLDGIEDDDADFISIPYAQGLTLAPQFNWIRAGKNGEPNYNDFKVNDFAFSSGASLDPNKQYDNIIEGRWSPYALASRSRRNSVASATNAQELPTFGPAWDLGTTSNPGTGGPSTDNPMSALQSVRVVFTPDKRLWSRSVVIEVGEYNTFNIGGAEKMDARKSPSVDKNGNRGDGVVTNDPEDADYISATGMGWFPGYAINEETGERLNIMFAEDSSMPTENGQDMIWNPTSTIISNTNRPIFGGRHYVYIMGRRTYGSGINRYEGARYDACASYITKLINADITSKRQVYSQAMWVSMPVLANGSSLRSPAEGLVPNQITVKIKVKRPYASYSIDGITVNDSMPYFIVSTKGKAPVISKEFGKTVLDKVNIVPNPYYAYSAYEDPNNQLDNRVRLVNLPARCDIRIFTLDGILVRYIKKDDAAAPYTEWDLKNDAKVPIVSGTYLIHIKANDFGEERVIKWFAVMRPVDFDTF
jgi:hypothetical protein